MSELHVYAIKFTGHYPVGAHAVVVAANYDEAKNMLAARLREHHHIKSLGDLTIVEILTATPSVLMLSDGDY